MPVGSKGRVHPIAGNTPFFKRLCTALQTVKPVSFSLKFHKRIPKLSFDRQRVQKAMFQTRQIAQVGRGRNGHFAAKFLGVGRHGARGDEPCTKIWLFVSLVVLGAEQLIHQQAAQSQVPQVVGGHAQCVIIV